MCNQYDDSKREPGAAGRSRREVLKAGAALIAAPLFGGAASSVQAAQATQMGVPVGDGPYSAKAYGATSATSPLGHLKIRRRAPEHQGGHRADPC